MPTIHSALLYWLVFNCLVHYSYTENNNHHHHSNLDNNAIITNNIVNNPDMYLSVPEIIARHGFISETHVVTTEDGYVLRIHRIPYGKNLNSKKKRQPVILQHAFLESSADFVICGENKSLAFLLSNAGYDVWMSNIRGNTYSKEHISLPTNDMKFWNFSWDEMAKYDMPAIIDYIANYTNQSGNILYIGHSMGTTIFFAMLSEQPKYNSIIKAMFAFAPVAGLKNVKSPIRLITPYIDYFESITNVVGQGELLPNNIIVKFLAKYACDTLNLKKLCENSIFIFTGYDEDQLDQQLVPTILSHSPAGTSTKTLIHFVQEMHANGSFQHYDYGAEKNLDFYGSVNPPKYNLSNVNVPVAVYYSDNDWIAVTQEVEQLYSQLPNKITLYKVPFKQFNHIDFVWAKDAHNLLYTPLIKLMAKYK